MAGHAGTVDLAGVGIGSSFWSVTVMLLSGIFMALNPIVAEAAGRKNYDSAAAHTQQGLWLALPLSVLLVAMLLNSSYYLDVIVESPDVRRVTRGYLAGLAFGVPAIIGALVLKPFCEGMSYTKAQAVSAAIGLGVNIPANYVLIFGKLGFPALGGAGCGWATAISFWTMLLVLATFARKNLKLARARLLERVFRPEKQGIIRILSIGIPIAIAITIEGSTFSLVTIFIAGRTPAEIAAHQIVINIAYLTCMVPLSIGTAGTIRVATFLGKKEPEYAHKFGMVAIVLALTCGLVMAAAL